MEKRAGVPRSLQQMEGRTIIMEEYTVLKIWGIVVVLILGGALITAASYYIDTAIVQPAQRVHQLNDPSRTIALRQDFHDKITEVLTANATIQASIHKIQNNTKTVPGYTQTQAYQDDQTELEGLVTIHTNTIAAYNQQARGVDTRDWNDICMPHSIADQQLDTSDLPTMLVLLQDEQHTLTAEDGAC